MPMPVAVSTPGRPEQAPASGADDPDPSQRARSRHGQRHAEPGGKPVPQEMTLVGVRSVLVRAPGRALRDGLFAVVGILWLALRQFHASGDLATFLRQAIPPGLMRLDIGDGRPRPHDLGNQRSHAKDDEHCACQWLEVWLQRHGREKSGSIRDEDTRKFGSTWRTPGGCEVDVRAARASWLFETGMGRDCVSLKAGLRSRRIPAASSQASPLFSCGHAPEAANRRRIRPRPRARVPKSMQEAGDDGRPRSARSGRRTTE